MIQVLKDYFDKYGNRYKVLYFTGEKYACESYNSGKLRFFDSKELFENKQKTVKQNVVVQPEYQFNEPEFDFEGIDINIDEIIKNKDNIEEKATDDLYADY